LPADPKELPELDPEFWRVLDDCLNASGLTMTGVERAAVDGHVRLLTAWNQQINLTALRRPDQIARNHVVDSLIALPALRSLAGAVESLVDIGSGGGFPGLPLVALLRPPRAALVESIAKKARFLDAAARQMQEALAAEAPRTVPKIAVHSERTEYLADEANQRESWHLVTARAVGTIAEVAELGLPLTRAGGFVVAWKLDGGDGSLRREIDTARRIIQACGGAAARIVRLEHAARVGLDGHCVVTIKKVRPTPDRYPRQPTERRRSR
jgi:16S rRNA (guanine527-N7)-methyltransferase